MWTRAYTLAGQGDRAGADRERRRAIEVRRGGPRAGKASGLVAEAKFHACAGEPERALEILRVAVADGLATATPLTDPSFVEVRRLPGFAEIAGSMSP